MPQEFTTTPGCTPETPTTQAKAREEAAATQATAQETKREAERAARDVQERAAAAADRARQGLGETAESAKHTAADAAHRARQDAQSFVARQKDSAADEIEHVGEAAQRAADKLHEEEDHNVASYVEAAASRAHSAAQYLKQRELNDLLADAQHVARQRPTAFYGGMFAAGVAIARFLKADLSPRTRHPGPRPGRSATDGEPERRAPQPITRTS